MEYASYGHECIVSIVVLLLVFHVTLDVLPRVYRRLREGPVSARVRIATGFMLILTASFLM